MKDDKNENSLMGGIMQIIVVILLIGMIYAVYEEIKRIIIERDYTRLTIYIIVGIVLYYFFY
jgi:uncharacterized membrane protein YidH (DUF202 family)